MQVLVHAPQIVRTNTGTPTTLTTLVSSIGYPAGKDANLLSACMKTRLAMPMLLCSSKIVRDPRHAETVHMLSVVCNCCASLQSCPIHALFHACDDV
jgi:hypothetical protein